MSLFRSVCLSLLLTTTPVLAAEFDLLQEIAKVSASYVENFNKKDAAGTCGPLHQRWSSY